MNWGCIKNMKKIILQNEPNYESKLNSFTHQEQAVEFAKDLDYAAIFHEQGLGKTKIALDIALYWLSKKDIDTVLIVTKKGLVKNWQEETKVHSYLHPKVLNNNRNSNFYVFNSATRLIITNFETISFPKSAVPDRADFGVRVCGDSMEPVYHDGQIAWIQECSELSPGEVGIFMYDGDGYIKMYDEQEPCEAERYDFTDSDGTLHMQSVLISYNKKYEPKLVSPLVRFSIVGRVLN